MSKWTTFYGERVFVTFNGMAIYFYFNSFQYMFIILNVGYYPEDFNKKKKSVFVRKIGLLINTRKLNIIH